MENNQSSGVQARGRSGAFGREVERQAACRQRKSERKVPSPHAGGLRRVKRRNLGIVCYFMRARS